MPVLLNLPPNCLSYFIFAPKGKNQETAMISALRLAVEQIGEPLKRNSYL